MHALFLSPLACLQKGGGELYPRRRNVTELQFKAELVEKKREDFDVNTRGEAKRQLACEASNRHGIENTCRPWCRRREEGRNKKVFLVSGPLLYRAVQFSRSTDACTFSRSAFICALSFVE